MEIGRPQLARLVLGYLKNENCTKAFNEFLTTSRYLTQHAPFVKNGKYFATRVAGQTLEDIINEYTEISLIIQGKLEQTSYYEEHHKMNLVEQLKYILDHDYQASPILPDDLNTTPSESLPGNSSTKSTPKNPNNQLKPTFGECSPIECIENISQMLSQTLLEKPELHEKLADAINSVRKTSQGQDNEVESATNQLDNKIRTIIQKAEEDPIFDEILGEIIGNKSDVPGQSGSKKFQSSCTQSQKASTSKSNDITKKKDVEYLDKRTLSKEQVRESTHAHLSADAMSIPPASTSTNVPCSTPNANSEVIIFNGNLDSYVGKTGTMMTPQQSQIYVTNTPGVLMLPPMITAPNYFFVNSQSNQVSSVLTDSDIMKMPTVILDEGVSKTQIKENATLAPPVRKCKALVPKSDNITVSTSCGNYLAVYKDDGQVIVNSSGGEEAPPTTKSTTKSNTRPVLRKKLHRQAKMKKIENVSDEEKRKDLTTPNSKTDVKKSTPKSGSHVRTLDFASPIRNDAENEKEEHCGIGKTDSSKRIASKNLFRLEKKTAGKKERRSRSEAWDSELRELLIPKDVTLNSPDTSNENLDGCEDDPELRNQAMLIEAAFKTPLKKNLNDEEAAPSQPSDAAMEEPEKEDATEEETLHNEKGSVETLTVTETQVYLRNCNAPPRFRRKCNASNNLVQTCEVEIVIEKHEMDEKRVNKLVKQTTESSHNAEVKRDVILETPIKDLPKTPGKCELTPFSRELEEQIRGMDLLSIPTPNLPITPSFPITPCINLNTPVHVNRPTDYSTSSSYYQPSDTEQNKSLEVMIEECKKLENRSEKVKGTKTEEEKDEKQENSASSANEIKRIFNQNVIGKKNLNLMKQASSSSSSSADSNSSYSSSSSSTNSDSEYDPSHNESVVARKDTYCLRRRTVTPKADEKVSKPTVPAKLPKKIKSVAEEIVDKRERVLKFLKNEDKNTPKPEQKNNQAKEKNCKTIKKTTSKRKSRSPIKMPLLKTNEQIAKLCDVENEITDDDFALHLSTDEDTNNKPVTESAAIKDKEESAGKTEKATPTDLEAEQLVQGLKERGIHLVHKKSPNKDCSFVEVTEKDEVDLGVSRINSEPDTTSKKATVQLISKIEEQEIEIKEIDIPTTGNPSSLNMSDNISDVTFDIELFDEDRQLRVDFSNSKKKSKRTVYDSKVLGKEMKANVYIESLDMEMERIIKCTPFSSILDIVPKITAGKTKKKSVKRGASPSCPFDETRERIEKKQTSCDKKKVTQEPKDALVSKVKSVEKKASVGLKKEHSDSQTTSHKLKTAIKRSGSEKCVKIDPEIIDISVESKMEKIFNSAPSCKVTSDVNRTLEEDLSSNKERLLNIQWGRSPVMKREDDDLMNYAIMGSQREENAESPRSANKRKYSSSEDGEPMEKKCKTEQQQALLKKIDVDMFLNKVHGNAGKS